MPSSSERTTYLETHLVHLLKLATYRLEKCRKFWEADFITDRFVEVLDCSYRDLTETFNAATDHDLVVKLETEAEQNTPSARIAWAGNALIEAGTALGRVGRQKEAAEFNLWGDELHALGVEVEKVERRVRGA